MWRLQEWFPTLFFISHCYFFVCFWELCLPNKGSLSHRPSLLFLWNYWKLFFLNSTKSRQATFLLLNVSSLTIFSPTASQLFRSQGTETKEGRASNNWCTCQTGAGGGAGSQASPESPFWLFIPGESRRLTPPHADVGLWFVNGRVFESDIKSFRQEFLAPLSVVPLMQPISTHSPLPWKS